VDCVTLERSFPHLAIVTLNRPEVRNAIDGCVATTLARFVAELDEDPSIRCAILTGAGDQAFSAGADLKEVAAGRRRRRRCGSCSPRISRKDRVHSSKSVRPAGWAAE
jgi:enoyl-CoA hydratase/carnithine racemase